MALPTAGHHKQGLVFIKLTLPLRDFYSRIFYKHDIKSYCTTV